jgi:N-acetylglutamate synthase
MDYTIRAMRQQDYQQMMALWKNTEGMGFSASDEYAPTARFIERNRDFCFVCEANNKIIGTILCGTDERRAYIYHLAVDSTFRRQGIASALVTAARGALKDAGIIKCGLFIFKTNESGTAFWKSCGFNERTDLNYLQIVI